MNKKGFTLIELLTVIALIGLIALIVTPQVIGIFNSSNQKSILLTAERLIDATETYINDYQIQYGKVLSNIAIEIIDNNIKNNPLKVSGSLPETGTIHINKDSIVAINIYDDGICAFKDYDWPEVRLFELSASDCNYSTLLEKADIEAPKIILETISMDENKIELQISVSENLENNLDDNNKYEYYISTSDSELIGGKWFNYSSVGKTTLTINKGTSYLYYLWVYPIKDKSGNTSISTSDINAPYVITKYSFDDVKPLN